jgi:hypothetical protein
MTLYPHGYGRSLVTLDRLRELHHPDKMHPEFARRLFAWIEAQGGQIGIGGSWRDDGSQPDKPGFAPEGKSFHQYQRFASGLIKFAAVDLVARNGTDVHRSPSWDEVPAQGTADAERWRVHCNVSTEAWHMQPIEIDGYATWLAAGSPDPLPTDPTEPGDDTVYRSITGAPRVLDTRNEGGALPKGGQRTVHAHRAGLADGATHVAVTVTAVDTAGPGFLTAWPAGPPPTSSFVNYSTKGATVAGFTIVPLSDFGTFEVAAPAAGCHVVVDVAGTFG